MDALSIFHADAPACIVEFSDAAGTNDLEDGSEATQDRFAAAHACGEAACWLAGVDDPNAAAGAKLVPAPWRRKRRPAEVLQRER